MCVSCNISTEPYEILALSRILPLSVMVCSVFPPERTCSVVLWHYWVFGLFLLLSLPLYCFLCSYYRHCALSLSVFISVCFLEMLLSLICGVGYFWLQCLPVASDRKWIGPALSAHNSDIGSMCLCLRSCDATVLIPQFEFY